MGAAERLLLLDGWAAGRLDRRGSVIENRVRVAERGLERVTVIAILARSQ